MPIRACVQFRQLGAVVQCCNECSEEFGGVLAEFGFQELDEVGDVPRDSHVAGHGKFRASGAGGEEGFELAEEGRVRLRFEQGDEVAEEGDARGGVGVGRCVQTPVRGENLAGFLQLAEHDEGEHQIVAANCSGEIYWRAFDLFPSGRIYSNNLVRPAVLRLRTS